MKVKLNTCIIGISGVKGNRVHAYTDDILQVILHNKTHFICNSIHYPKDEIIVFNSQCDIIPEEGEIEDAHSIEKYYNVYDPTKSINDLEDDLPYSTLQSDDELLD